MTAFISGSVEDGRAVSGVGKNSRLSTWRLDCFTTAFPSLSNGTYHQHSKEVEVYDIGEALPASGHNIALNVGNLSEVYYPKDSLKIKHRFPD